MSDTTIRHLQQEGQLRRDLRSVIVAGRRRGYRIVIDEVSGRFTRISEHGWQTLQKGEPDDALWQEAQTADWTRDRTHSKRARFSPLYFRIPFGTIDGVAARLAPISGAIFSGTAILIWCTVISIAAILALGRLGELAGTLGSLQRFLAESDPLWLGVSLVGTKIAHELAHAVMCRRMGARCGKVGLLFLVGVPCPYCDVTDIWRQPSSAKRAAVMMAGIYVELIIAALAMFVWIGASDPTLRLHALNLVVICGISTLLFNANPLMRYDGYYVLGDLINSVNLRQEAARAFRSCAVARIAGDQYKEAKRTDIRSLSLTFYHAASTTYRWIMLLAIASLLVVVAERFQMRPLAVGIVIVAIGVVLTPQVRNLALAVQGTGRWARVPLWRRGFFTGMIGLLLAGILFTPLPRYRSADGSIDLANSSTVFLASEGMIEDVRFEFGDPVQSGDTLVRLRNESLAIDQAKLRGQLQMARLRSNLSRRVTLDRSDHAEQWKTLQAAEDAVVAQLASVEQRVRETEIVAPVTGTVLPPVDAHHETSPPWLRDQAGLAAVRHKAWCRISTDGSLHAVLLIDARDRKQIDVGATVKLCLNESPEKVFTSTVVSVSAMEQDEPSVTRQATYQVLCPMPTVNANEMLRWVGKNCQGVFHLPKRTLATDLTHWIGEWMSG